MSPSISQPSIRRLAYVAALLSLVVISAGCAKKQPATAVDSSASHTRDVSPQLGSGLDSGAQTVSRDSAPSAVEEGLLGAVYFAFDRADLSAEGEAQLARNAQYLQQHADITVLIEGHCDELGTDEYNLALGERRAAAARDYLIRQGIAPTRLRTMSYGESRPSCFESSASCWPLNRRAHFVGTERSPLG